MSENTTTTIENELEIESAPTLEEIVNELVTEENYTSYKIAVLINKVFVIVEFPKSIPPQMMYNYSRNGLINKVKGCKSYTQDEVKAFINKYVSKQINK